MTDIEGAICDACGNRIGPYGCCATIRALLADLKQAEGDMGGPATPKVMGYGLSVAVIDCPRKTNPKVGPIRMGNGVLLDVFPHQGAGTEGLDVRVRFGDFKAFYRVRVVECWEPAEYVRKPVDSGQAGA